MVACANIINLMEKEIKISVVIPNYNGSDLLEKNLPSVLKIFPKDEIIVVDDASKDESVALLRNNFPQINLIALKSNCGFANAVNAGIKISTSDIIVLINTDVRLDSDIRNSIVKSFASQSDLFAISFGERSHEGGKIVIRGRGTIRFNRGLIAHKKAESTRGSSLWASGGSAAFDRQKLASLGLFDQIYSPFYWEDVDLGWRAWKAGYKIIFDPSIQIDHYHRQGSIKKSFSDFQIRRITFRNQLIFFWENISDVRFWLTHLIWLPLLILLALKDSNLALPMGFVSALIKIPQIVLKRMRSKIHFKLADREVLKKFEEVS